MEIHKFAKKTFWSLLLVGMMLCCVSEDDYPGEEKKPVEPLTIESARSLYEQYVGTTASLKSAGEDSGIELLPDWNAGQLFSDSLWYVVESPLEFIGDRQMRLVTPSVEEYVGPEAKASDIKQYQRLVMAQNKESGETYAFVMMIIPELDYMLQKGDRLDVNKYFSREHDLDGRIMFFTTDGRFINGWIYEQGKLTAFIGSGNNANNIFRTKTYNYYWDCIDKKEYNELGILISEKECFKVYILGDITVNGTINTGHDNDGSIGWPGGGGINKGEGGLGPIDTGDGSGGGGSNIDKDKEPEKRTDCDEKAEQNANNANSAMASTITNSAMNTLRDYAKNKTNEFNSYIGITNQGNYIMGNIIEGDWSSGNVDIYESTLYNVHTHTKSSNASITDYTGPSVEDMYNLLDANKYFTGDGHTNLRGIIIFAFDGSE